MLEYRSMAAEAAKRRQLRSEFRDISASSWLWMCLQIIRVFVLQRVTLEGLSKVPGVQPDAVCLRAREAIKDAGRQ